jgi:hypothetical protein
MQAEVVHREVSKEEAALKSSRALKKRHRDWQLAAERRCQPEERTRGNCRSRKKLAVAGRKMTRRAGMARRKVQVVRKNQTRDKVASGTLMDGRSG